MSLLETERRSQKRARRKRKQPRKRGALQAPLPFLPREGELHDEQVLNFRQWCGLNGFSPRTGHRILASGDGPTVTQLSDKRFGVTVANNRAWQARRSR
jgi:hypothetical protein